MNSRSNEDRLGMVPDVPNTPPQEVSPPPLNFISPTEFVELPSQGKYYVPGHPLHNKSVLEVKHMTTKEEDILTSTALLQSGLAIQRLLESIIVDKQIKVDDLLLGDKNALLIAARSHGYGAIYETVVTCPDCNTEQDYGFDLTALGVQSASDEYLEENNVQTTDQNTFLISLPKTDYVVEVRLLTGHDENSLTKIEEHKKKRNLPQTAVTDFLRAIIISVNGISDMNSLNGFINNLPALHGRYLRKIYDGLVPTIDLKHTFQCTNCDHEGTLEVPLSADFFWPKS